MKIQKQLGGQLRTLLFDLGTLEHIGELTGEDGFQFAINIKEFKSFRKDLSLIICAGLRAHYDDVEKEYDFTLEDVVKWTKRVSRMSDAIEVLAAFHKAYQAEVVSEEGNTDTQSVLASNVARYHEGRTERVEPAS